MIQKRYQREVEACAGNGNLHIRFFGVRCLVARYYTKRELNERGIVIYPYRKRISPTKMLLYFINFDTKKYIFVAE